MSSSTHWKDWQTCLLKKPNQQTNGHRPRKDRKKATLSKTITAKKEITALGTPLHRCTVMNDNKAEKLTEKQINALRNAIACGKINLDDVLRQDEEMKKQKILKQHKYPISYGKGDNRWHTYIPDDTRPNGRKSVAKRNKDDLEEYLIAFYSRLEKVKKEKAETLKSFYPVWLRHKNLETKQGDYIKRIDSDWRKYYAKDPISDIPLTELTAGYLRDWCLKSIKERNLTKTQFYNMSIILRQGLQYAFDIRAIPSNPFEKVRVDSKLFAKPGKKADSEEVFLYDEQPKLEKAAYEDFEKTGCTFSLSIPLSFQLGIRVGECVALKFSDVDELNENYIHIQRMEVDDYTLTDDSRVQSRGHKVVEHTKTEAGDREIYLTKKAREIIQTIYDFNKAHDLPTNGYIFVNKNGNAHRSSMDYRLRKCCRIAGIAERSTHKIRKSYVSTLIDCGEINIKQIMRTVGHRSAKTTYGNYCFNRRGEAQTQESFEKALSFH